MIADGKPGVRLFHIYSHSDKNTKLAAEQGCNKLFVFSSIQ